MNNNSLMLTLKYLGIPGVPPSINVLLKGSIYAAIVDSVPAHLSIIIQALKANLAGGNTCVLVTKMTPGVFLSRAKASGVDFNDDITQSRLYLFSQEGDYTTNIFRHGIRRFLQEFDYFRVPAGSFFLFDDAGDLFTMSDQHMAQTQAMDYRDWMKSTGNTSLFLFPFKGEKRSQSILSCFNGVARINQSKVGLELLIDFWYSQEGAIAAKAFPVSLDTSGLIRIDHSLPEASIEAYQTESNADDHNTVFYFGPDFEAFSSAIHHTGKWKQAQSFVDLVHLSRDAARATVVISLDNTTELKQIAKIVHYLRLNRGNRLRIVIRESGFSLRYLNELLLLRFGANLIIHQQVAKQQLPLLWEMLAGQTYARKIKQNFDLAYSSILSSDHKGYVDLVTFCSESLDMFERGDVLDIPLALIVASYHEHTSPPEVLNQIHIVRNGDLLSSNETHCYIFMHACAEENVGTALSRITNGLQQSLFLAIRVITKKETIRETLQSLVQSGNIALAPDFSEAIAAATAAAPIPEPLGSDPILDAIAQPSIPPADTATRVIQPQACEIAPETRKEPNEIAKLMSRLASAPPSLTLKT
jgi:cellulose biosynthesis protein BcsE